MTERFVEDARHLVPVPHELENVGVLVEPFSIPEKAWRVATGLQQRVPGWQPKTAVVFGAGPIGLMTVLVLRTRGLDVYALDLKPADSPAADIVRATGAQYVSTGSLTSADLKRDLPPIDLIIECTGSSVPVITSMEILGNNGALILLSITGGNREMVVPTDRLNLEFILGNKAMAGCVNSSQADFRAATEDLAEIESRWPGLAESLITKRLQGLAAGLDLPGAMADEVKAVIEVGG